MSIKIQMLDDTQEAFEVPVSGGCICKPQCVWAAFGVGSFVSFPCFSDMRWQEEGLRIVHPQHSSDPFWF